MPDVRHKAEHQGKSASHKGKQDDVPGTEFSIIPAHYAKHGNSSDNDVYEVFFGHDDAVAIELF